MSDLHGEGKDIKESCSEFNGKAVAGCAVTLFTDAPFHIATGNLAPQNGTAFGGAFVEHYTPTTHPWRLGFSADIVAAPSTGSWRGGVYMKMVRTRSDTGVTVRTPGAPGANTSASEGRDERPVFDVYFERNSLERLLYFGPALSSSQAGRSAFSESQSIVGTTAIIPLTGAQFLDRTRASFVGAVNGRFVSVAGTTFDSTPSIADLYTEQTAPGLTHQPGFAQFEEGIRFKPSILDGGLRLNYLVDFQQFVADSAAHSSFHRWSLDLGHEIPLYNHQGSPGPRSREFNTPNECGETVGSTKCPPISWSRNRSGTIAFRFLSSVSSAFEGDSVPFYFQPTLGGSDINGQRLLAAYDDYRFRGRKMFAVQESIEHSIAGPVGAFFLADQGKVGDSEWGELAHSYAAGLTIRAGGFPVINLSIAWGPDGHHVIGSLDAALLGGSSRPSLH